MQRQFDPAYPELMDRPEAPPAELSNALRNLRRLNRFFGSYRLIRHFLRRWVKRGARLAILDLGTGSGDIPRLIVDHTRELGAKVTIDAVDFQRSTVEMAESLSETYPQISYHCADVLTFDSGKTYDLVVCSLALHHFGDEDAVRLLARMNRLSQRYVLVSDLRRGRLGSVGVYLLTSLFFADEMTRTDARLSAERAFSTEELRSLAKRAGWRKFKHRPFRFARQAIWKE